MEKARPDISIVVPVLNESQRINTFLNNLKPQTAGHEAEIIVVDGAQDCGTIAAIDDSQIIRLAGPKGRARQMNAGSAIAKGRVLLFLHADTILPPGALDAISEVMETPECAAGAFEIKYDSKRPVFGFIAWRNNLRCRVTRIAYGDQGIFIRKEYFERIGGYREYDFLEDVDLMRRIKRDGKKIRILKSRLKISPRRWEKEGIFYCMIRNQIMVMLFHFGFHPDKLARFYRKVI